MTILSSCCPVVGRRRGHAFIDSLIGKARCASTQHHGPPPSLPLRSTRARHHRHDRAISATPMKLYGNRGSFSAASPSPDRELRRRRLQDALHRVTAFRQWCTTQQQQCTSPARRTVSAKTVSAATLADVADTHLDSAQSLASSSLSNAADPSTPLPASSHLKAPIPAMERRLLTHYAGLLYEVLQAAVQVATSDFAFFYASAVAAALSPASPSSNGALTSFCGIPRSTVWESAEPQPGARGSRDSDGVGQAERRLAYWAGQWHGEVLQRHGHPSAHRLTNPAGDVDGASLRDVDSDGEDDGAGDGGDNGGEGGSQEPSLARLLLHGDWPQALRLLTSTAESASPTSQQVEDLFSPAALRHRRRVWLRPSRTAATVFPRLPRHRATAPVTAVELRLLQFPPCEGLRVLAPAGAQPAATKHGREFLRAAAAHEAAQGRAPGVPPSCVVRLRRRLWVLQHLPRSLPPSLLRFEEPTRVGGAAASVAATGMRESGRQRHCASTPRPYLLRCDALEKLPWYPLCVLGRVFALTTDDDGKSVDGLSRAERIAEVLRGARGHLRAALFLFHAADYASVLDYVHLLFVSLGSAMTAHQVAVLTQRRRGGGICTGAAADAASLLESAFANTAIALFQPPDHASYAAAEVGAFGVLRDGGGNNGNGSGAQIASSAQVDVATWSSLMGRVEETEKAVSTATAGAAKEASADPEEVLLPSSSGSGPDDITAVRRVSVPTYHHLCTAAQRWSNYHRSLYCETLSLICDGSGVALREMCRVLRGVTRNDGESVVVLAPESAAAVATAVLLQRLAHPSRISPSPVRSASCGASFGDEYPDLLFFAIPHDKAFAVASYFKGVFHPSFFQRVRPEAPTAETALTSTVSSCSASSAAASSSGAWPSSTLVLPPVEWECNALARLVGRSLRRVDRYPTRTTEAFFARYIRGDACTVGAAPPHADQHSVSGDARPPLSELRSQHSGNGAVYAPPLAVDVYTIDLRAAAAHWCDTANTVKNDVELSHATRRRREDEGPQVEGKDAVVLVAAPPLLPHGLHVIYKPAHVNCTLHAHYDSLVYPFLSRDLPWRGGDRHLREKESKAASADVIGVVPSTRQQGLVNRIDVGTSGAVLVARDSTSLQCATDAMLRQHLTRKTYRALVQRWPPLSARLPASRSTLKAFGSSDGGTPITTRGESLNDASLFSTAPFLSSLPSAVVCAPVYAAGGTASAIQHQQQQQQEPQQGYELHDGRPGEPHIAQRSSTPTAFLDQDPHQRYSRLHAALHDRRPAVTRYRVLEWFESTGVAYVQVDLDSGRRHQIRQHFALIGFPLVGDTRYHPGVMEGRTGTCFGLQRAALHAYSIELLLLPPPQAMTAAAAEEEPGRVVVQVPLPVAMQNALRTLRALEKETSRSRPPPT
ncbi:RNA pseudouridylate synthase-like protein [Leptomonas pyrrhocoris]|uniref:RNA pseudouridylate synthase-like protein n=1 Tax=Leptomonas pyrrhocoris TaxID=157538 RepID=A0A0M9FT17_LEPPY|nr:RNA pseudouridylate synthase-like protein [Leptomonas pyrrhocoris]KPA75465.1 RNA pseudouridylate synthase-like protein [Leptomonas pyrrhocoris]|eukprot:XP_015653904.1 RNA pseudouridylate synthase-like protein [Leptomonas pyrrhocoris]